MWLAAWQGQKLCRWRVPTCPLKDGSVCSKVSWVADGSHSRRQCNSPPWPLSLLNAVQFTGSNSTVRKQAAEQLLPLPNAASCPVGAPPQLDGRCLPLYTVPQCRTASDTMRLPPRQLGGPAHLQQPQYTQRLGVCQCRVRMWRSMRCTGSPAEQSLLRSAAVL